MKIPRNENSRSLQGEEVRQSKIVNTEFWIFNFIEDVPTRYTRAKGTKGKTLVQIRPNEDSLESESKKFFTGSSDILYTLRKVKEMDKFPRKVTLRGSNNRFYIE